MKNINELLKDIKILIIPSKQDERLEDYRDRPLVIFEENYDFSSENFVLGEDPNAKEDITYLINNSEIEEISIRKMWVLDESIFLSDNNPDEDDYSERLDEVVNDMIQNATEDIMPEYLIKYIKPYQELYQKVVEADEKNDIEKVDKIQEEIFNTILYKAQKEVYDKAYQGKVLVIKIQTKEE